MVVGVITVNLSVTWNFNLDKKISMCLGETCQWLKY